MFNKILLIQKKNYKNIFWKADCKNFSLVILWSPTRNFQKVYKQRIALLPTKNTHSQLNWWEFSLVEPKPAIIEAFSDVKPTVNVKLKVKITFQVHIAHIEEKPKLVPTGVGKVFSIEVDTDSFLITNERWQEWDDLLGWVRQQAVKAGFTISIDKSSLKR